MIPAEIFQNLLADSADAIIVTDHLGVVRFWNKAAELMLGYCSAEMVEHPLQQVLPEPGSLPITEVQALCKSGKRIWVERSMGTTQVDGHDWCLYVVRNSDQRRRQIEVLEREASTDSVSGLSNRREFQRLLEANLGKPITLAIIDIDNFKEINDQFGHWVGDEAIQFVSQNLSDLFPDAICIARLGGDEFGVLAEFATLDEAREGFQAFRTKSTERAPDAHLTAIPKVSIGVAFSQEPETSARELLTLADRLMYQSKRAGGNRISCDVVDFQPDA